MTGLALRVFLQETTKLKLHLDILERMPKVNETIQNSNVGTSLKEIVNNVLYKNADEKIFDYNSNVISLYGYWEKYVESLIKEYLNALRKLNTGNDNRNKRISSKYQKSLIPLFGKVVRKSYKYRNLTERNIVEALYKGCFQGLNDYIPEAFMQSGGNYNYNETADCLKRLGFSDISTFLCRYNPLKNYFTGKGMTEAAIYSTEPNVLYSKLNDVVLFRNEIAHGSTGVNTIDASEMLEYVEFLEVLANALYLYVNDDILEEVWTKKKSSEIEVRQYFDKVKVAELRKGVFYIDRNNPILCYRGKSVYPHYVYTRITSMNVDNVPYADSQYLSDDATQKVTVVFDFKVRKGDLLKFED